jgi:NitT/TauT family transport system substrate-binding protein
MSKRIRYSCLAVIALLLLAACGTTTASQQLTPLTIQLRWTHQAQFAGFYVADQTGYYAAEGLSVNFREGGPSVDVLEPVLKGSAQLGVTNADVLIPARADGQHLRALATIYRRSPVVYMALASSGITRPEDFEGKRIESAPNGRFQLYAVVAHAGLQPNQYTVVDLPPDLARFYAGQDQVRSVFLTNEVLTARAAGYKVNIIYPDDYGVHFYADSIFATDEFIAAQPDLVLRFLRASLKGWTYAVENTQTAAPMVLKIKPDADAAHENAFLLASLSLINTGEDHIGWMKPEVWSGMEKTLRAQGVLTRSVVITQVYTLQFLQTIYAQ